MWYVSSKNFKVTKIVIFKSKLFNLIKIFRDDPLVITSRNDQITHMQSIMTCISRVNNTCTLVNSLILNQFDISYWHISYLWNNFTSYYLRLHLLLILPAFSVPKNQQFQFASLPSLSVLKLAIIIHIATNIERPQNGNHVIYLKPLLIIAISNLICHYFVSMLFHSTWSPKIQIFYSCFI